MEQIWQIFSSCSIDKKNPKPRNSPSKTGTDLIWREEGEDK